MLAERADSAEFRAFNLELAQYWDEIADELERKSSRGG
jgi:hypothetical protein